MGKADPATEIYEMAQQDMKAELEKMTREIKAAREESYALGILKKIQYDNTHNEFLEYAVLYNVKRAKAYKKGGMTWKQFCESLGKSVRRVDEILSDIRPLAEKFSADFADLAGIEFSKIRYLGRSISADSAEITENGIRVDGDETIPITPEHKDDIEAYIDSLKKSEAETRKAQKEQVKAKERAIQTLYKTIADRDRELKRYTRAAPRGDSDAEKAQLKGIRELKGQFEVFLKGMGADVNLYLYNASERVKAAYAALIVYAMKGCESIRDDAYEDFGISIFPQMADLEAPAWLQDDSGADE